MVVLGGDNPTDFLEDIMGNEVFTAWPTLLMKECEQEYRVQLGEKDLLLIRGEEYCTLFMKAPGPEIILHQCQHLPLNFNVTDFLAI